MLGSALPAAAGDRPTNGRITFARFAPALGATSIWAANPDGSHQQVIVATADPVNVPAWGSHPPKH